MRVLVTGGAGFIGSHVADAALGEGHEVAVLDNLSTGKRENVPKKAKLFEVDLREREAVRRAVEDFRPDAVSHQAAQASVSVSMRDPALDVAVNVMGGLHLADACAAVGTKRFVFASTGGAIYGEVPEGKSADETTTPAPMSPYAISKLTFEQLLGVYRSQHGLETWVLRYANVYGPRQNPHGEAGVVAIFCDRALAGESLRVNARKTAGDEGCVRDYVFVDDVVRANALALGGELADRVLNVGTGVGVTTNHLAAELLRAIGASVAIDSAPVRVGDLERSVLDPSRYVAVLGKPTDLVTGLAKTAEWYRTRS